LVFQTVVGELAKEVFSTWPAVDPNQRHVLNPAKQKNGYNTVRSTVVPLPSTDDGSTGLDFGVRMGSGIFPVIWSYPTFKWGASVHEEEIRTGSVDMEERGGGYRVQGTGFLFQIDSLERPKYQI
jgi:hypothetical protein